MKAVGTVRHRLAGDRHRRPAVTIPVGMESRGDKSIPIIAIELRPADDFCEGMAYERMEAKTDDPVETITLDMDITLSLILYLRDSDGGTESTVLCSMATAIGRPDLIDEFDVRTRLGDEVTGKLAGLSLYGADWARRPPEEYLLAVESAVLEIALRTDKTFDEVLDIASNSFWTLTAIEQSVRLYGNFPLEIPACDL